MDISHETGAQTQARLLRVLAAAALDWKPQAYAFQEAPIDRLPLEHLPSALAFVRDDTVWSALAPSADETVERYAVWSFHFPAGMDNSGFVGWLASHLKTRLGTGVLVVCGHNAARGGIFDYWGVPLSVREAAAAEMAALRGSLR